MSDPKCYGICVKNTKVFGLPNNDIMKKIDEGTILEIYYLENVEGIIFSIFDDEMHIDNQMYCGLTQDFIRVNKKLWPFLVGIKNPVERNKFIKNRELTNFILGIEINDEVLFKMDSNQNLIKGLVRYITLVPSIGHGLFFGIEVPDYNTMRKGLLHTVVVAANLIHQTGPSKFNLFNEDETEFLPLVQFKHFIEAADKTIEDSYIESVQFLKENLRPQALKSASEKMIEEQIFYNRNYIGPTTSTYQKVEVPCSSLITTNSEDEYEVNQRKHEDSLKNVNDDMAQALESTPEKMIEEQVHYNHNYTEPKTSTYRQVEVPSSSLITTISEDEYEVNRRKHEISLKNLNDDMDGATALPDYWKHLFVKNPTIWICKNCTLENVMTSFNCAACDQPIIREKPDHLREDNEPKFIPYLRQPNHHKENISFMDDDNDVVPNHDEFQCPLCLKTCLPNDGVVLRDCIHSLCKLCVRESIISNLDLQIKCPYKTTYVCESNLQDREIKGIVGQDIYDEHLARITLQIRKDKNIFNCRNENCLGFGFIDEQETSFECSECKTINCTLCRDIHNGMNCEEFEKSKILQKELSENKKEVSFTAHYFQCQYCSQYTKGVYLDKCNHSVCNICLIKKLTTTKTKNIKCPVINCNEQVEERVRKHILTSPQYERYLFRCKDKIQDHCQLL